MLSHSSSVQHSSGTHSLQTCKTSLVTVNSRRTLKHTGQHTSTQQSFAFRHEIFHDEPCMRPNYTHLEQLNPSHVHLPTELYADDALIHETLTRNTAATNTTALQGAVNDAEQWALSWNGRFGHEKTKLLNIG